MFFSKAIDPRWRRKAKQRGRSTARWLKILSPFPIKNACDGRKSTFMPTAALLARVKSKGAPLRRRGNHQGAFFVTGGFLWRRSHRRILFTRIIPTFPTNTLPTGFCPELRDVCRLWKDFAVDRGKSSLEAFEVC